MAVTQQVWPVRGVKISLCQKLVPVKFGAICWAFLTRRGATWPPRARAQALGGPGPRPRPGQRPGGGGRADRPFARLPGNFGAKVPPGLRPGGGGGAGGPAICPVPVNFWAKVSCPVSDIENFPTFLGTWAKFLTPVEAGLGGHLPPGRSKVPSKWPPLRGRPRSAPPFCPGPGTGGGRPGGPADCPGHGQLWGQSPLPGLRQKKFCPGPGPAKRGVPVAGFF